MTWETFTYTKKGSKTNLIWWLKIWNGYALAIAKNSKRHLSLKGWVSWNMMMAFRAFLQWPMHHCFTWLRGTVQLSNQICFIFWGKLISPSRELPMQSGKENSPFASKLNFWPFFPNLCLLMVNHLIPALLLLKEILSLDAVKIICMKRKLFHVDSTPFSWHYPSLAWITIFFPNLRVFMGNPLTLL